MRSGSCGSPTSQGAGRRGPIPRMRAGRRHGDADDGAPVGWARASIFERENLDKCWFQLEVDPQHRRQGVGAALVEWTEQQAKDAGRDLLLTQVFVPVGARASHGDREFALRRGYTVSSVEIVRSLPLPVAILPISIWPSRRLARRSSRAPGRVWRRAPAWR